MADSARPRSPSSLSRVSSVNARPSTGPSEALETERLTYIHPADLSPVEAANLKDEEADRLIAQGDPDGALHALQKAIYFRPDHAPFHAKIARVYWDLCDSKSAMACYRKLFSIERSPSQRIKDQFASLLDLHAYSLLMLGETPPVAIAYLTEAIQLNSLEEAFWLHRALAYIHSNCFDKALKDVDHCVNLNGRDVEYFVLRAKLHWKLHMHEKATQDIHKAARLMPNHPEVVEHEQRLLKESQTIYAQACKHLMVKKYAEAIKCLTNAAEISPEETKIYLLRASAYRERGDLQTALKDIDKAMSCHRLKLEAAQKKKADIEAYLSQQHQNGRRHRGVAAVGVAVAASPSTVSAPAIVDNEGDHTREYKEIATQRNLILNDLALRFLREKSFQVALNAMNQVIVSELEISSKFKDTIVNPQYSVNRGDAYRGLGNLHAALADYHHALEMTPDNQEVRSRVAFIHYQFGIDLFNQAQFHKAEVEFAKAIKEDDSVATYHVRKGDAARFQERHHVACEDYLNAMAINPHDSDTSNKLLQYAIDPSTRRATASHSNASVRTTGFTPSAGREEASQRSSSSPRQHQHPQQQPTQAKAVEEAYKSYQKKNKMVKDLFTSRPTLPPAKEPKR